MRQPRTLAALAIAAALAASAAAMAAPEKPFTVKVEPIPGGPTKRVTLAPRAMQRLGIELGEVREEVVLRRQLFSGLTMRPVAASAEPGPALGAGFAGFTRTGRSAEEREASPTSGPGAELWVHVSLSPGELEKIARDKPARLMALSTEAATPVTAMPTKLLPTEDPRRSMLSVYYVLEGNTHGIPAGKRMRVELQLAGGSEAKQKVVPYGAVYYDARGSAWVYVTTAPQTFERRLVAVERVVGDLAVLSEGPSVGTPVVKVGAALLYGAEIFGK